MSLGRPIPFVCRSCSRLSTSQPPKVFRVSKRPYSNNNAPVAGRPPPRVAIIGSGPAGFYAAYRLMKKSKDAVVDMYEKLPAPYGLVRYGVAPDHPEVKNCQDTFDEVASSPNFNFLGNINVGHDLSLNTLRPHYDAILFAYGASEDKNLGVPGEDLEGVYSARAFVGWYNGLPEYAHLKPMLDTGDTAVIIGHGNVALDVARILLTDVEHLRKTDITDYAAEALSKSKIRNVQIVGRRGPMQAAFTIKEVRELMTLPSVFFSQLHRRYLPEKIEDLPRREKRLMRLLAEGTSSSPSVPYTKSWALRFLLSPASFESESDSGFLSSIAFSANRYAPTVDYLDKSARVVSAGDTVEIPTSTAFRSVGYKSTPIPGLSKLGVLFDKKQGIIPNDASGRIINPFRGPGSLPAAHVSGLYAAGWVKTGPTGVIATTMNDAFATADAMHIDLEQSARSWNNTKQEARFGWEALKRESEAKGLRVVSWEDWKEIDWAERERGKAAGKERKKFASVKEMLAVLDG
ncbi:nucleotide-binding domain-containing protein [Aulographum hederae CBS 113979]|uniref:NADPH:adrenodoxin oxidoreductase, mitochondrial n=1 Tax=Aulographum hederae CBS 113979 TaxID=1176131 RepID=A0A6G1HG90_9PEZI|nr:nucleotide-binding domain-containing protein [Aulographum hederae CBS 113979]